jgi:hypothetical protein
MKGDLTSHRDKFAIPGIGTRTAFVQTFASRQNHGESKRRIMSKYESFQDYPTCCPYLAGSLHTDTAEIGRYPAIGLSNFFLDVLRDVCDLAHGKTVYEIATPAVLR